MDNIMIKPRAVVDDLKSFSPTLPDRTVAELRQILGIDEVIKLSFNESPYGPSPRAISAVQQAVANVALYHDPEGKQLREKLAALYAVDAAQIVLGNGADDIITLLAQALLAAGDNVVIPTPTFGQYAFATRLMEAEPVFIPVAADMSIDLAAMSKAINAKTKMVILCNPNNPTGMILGPQGLRQFLQAVPQEVVVVLDEAYAEYVTDNSFLSGLTLLSEFPNIIVVRTFSKIYGMAALRLGYGIAQPWLIELANRVRNLFNVNYLAQVAASAALDDAAFRDYVVRLNTAQRYRLTDALTSLGGKVYPSQTNFVFADFGAAAATYYTELAKRGIIVRQGTGWNFPNCLRISLGDSAQNDKLIAAMYEIRFQQSL